MGSPSIYGFNAATYTVTQTAANGCTSAPAAISSNPNSIPTPPIITPRSATTFCQGGSVILTSSAKTRNLWSTGATTQSIVVNSSGTYTVAYTSNDGCTTISVPVTVTVNPIPAAPSIAVESNCGNSVLTANSTGTLHWSNGAATFHHGNEHFNIQRYANRERMYKPGSKRNIGS